MPQTLAKTTYIPKQRRIAGFACALLIFGVISFLLWALTLNKPSLSVIKAPASERIITTATVTKNSLYISGGGSRNTSATRDLYVSFVEQTGKTVNTKIEIAPFSTHFTSSDFDPNGNRGQGEGATVSIAYLAKNPAKYVYPAEVTGSSNYWKSILSSMFGTYLFNPVIFLLSGAIFVFSLMFAIFPGVFEDFKARGRSPITIFLLLGLGTLLVQIPIYLVLN